MDEGAKNEKYESGLPGNVSASQPNKDHRGFEKEQRELRGQISEHYHAFVYNK